MARELKNRKDLPAGIQEDLEGLFVDRSAGSPGSHMRTEAVTGYVAPGRRYRLETGGFSDIGAADGDFSVPEMPNWPGSGPQPPAHLRVSGTWDRTENNAASDANLFGGFGTLEVAEPVLRVPEAPSTPEALAFYGARLIDVGSEIVFQTNWNLPVTLVDMGPRYVPDYLHADDLGGGSFIEFHDRPHLHMPLDDTAYGHMLFGRRDGDDYLLSLFSVPFGSAIYTEPFALHADPYLVGRFLVVYGLTDNYSTVAFRTPQNGMVEVTPTEAGAA